MQMVPKSKNFPETKLKPEESSKTGESGSRPASTRCFNCNKFGHLAPNCKMPKRERGACFKCFEIGHQIKDCPKNIKDKDKDKSLQINNISEKKNDDNEKFFKDVVYEITFTGGKFDLLLDTLLDTGSPVSFMKKSFVPEVILCSSDLKMSKYKGINDTGLQFFGSVRANIKMNDCISNDMSIFVVPDSTMKSSVVLGRDVINSFESELMSRDSSHSVRAINESLSINVENELAKIT